MSDLPDFDALWNYGDPAATEQKFRDILPTAESSGDTGYHTELLTQIARTLGLQQKFDEAHALLDQVEAMLSAEPSRARVRYLLERGRAFNSSGAPDKARPLFIEAWEMGQTTGEDFYAVDAAHMVAIAESGPAVMEWNLKALGHAEQSSQPRARYWLGSLYNNIGWTYHDQGEFEAALDIFQKALAVREADGKPEPIRIARWCIGRVLRSLGRLDEALALQRALLADYDAINAPSGYTYEELGECLLALDKPDEARPYFAQAYAELSQDSWLVRNEPERLARLKELGA